MNLYKRVAILFMPLAIIAPLPALILHCAWFVIWKRHLRGMKNAVEKKATRD